jgi:hypothetical protein
MLVKYVGLWDDFNLILIRFCFFWKAISVIRRSGFAPAFATNPPPRSSVCGFSASVGFRWPVFTAIWVLMALCQAESTKGYPALFIKPDSSGSSRLFHRDYSGWRDYPPPRTTERSFSNKKRLFI